MCVCVCVYVCVCLRACVCMCVHVCVCVLCVCDGMWYHGRLDVYVDDRLVVVVAPDKPPPLEVQYNRSLSERSVGPMLVI